MSSEDILTLPPPPADARLAYGTDPNQFADLRLPKTKGPFPVVMNIHGGFWRARYTLAHAGHLCAALTAKGIATWNIEYRRVGNPGGGWPGTFEDVRNGYRYLAQITKRYNFDSTKVLVMGHSAGGQLALCLAAHEASVKRGYLDFQRLFVLTLSSAFFVVRTKANVLLQRRHSHAVDKRTGVRSDQAVILSSFASACAYPDALRRVSYFDAETGKQLKFLTNNFTLPALTIAQIYKQRWQVRIIPELSWA